MKSGGGRTGAGGSVPHGDPPGRRERSVSPTVGIILLFGMVLIGASVVALAGMALMDDLQSSSADEQGEQVLRQIDHDIASEEEAIQFLNDGEYNITDEGDINVTVTTWSGTQCALLDESMGTLHSQRSDGSTIAHQAGGIFLKTDSGSRVLSGPDIRYYTTEADGEEVKGVQLSLTDLQGTAGSGTHRATYERKNPDACEKEAEQATQIEITVAGTPYHQGWAQFLNSTFDEKHVTYDESQQKVTATASLGAARPLQSYIGLDPTIYGGLYVEETDPIDERLTIDRYDGSVGWDRTDPDNITEDLFVSGDDLALRDDAHISGVPVTNGVLTGDTGANVTTVGYANGFAVPSFGTDDVSGTPLYNVTGTYPADVYGAEMDTSFAAIGDINTNITEAIDHIENNPRAKNIERTLGVPAGESDVLYHTSGSIGRNQIDAIDTSGGTVHVAVENKAQLEDVTVTGDGQAYFYVSGSIDVENVTIENERARGLWVYGTSSASIDVTDEFHGVLYAPESRDLTLHDDAEVYGSLVGGHADIGDDVTVHFDETLRTDVPIPQTNRGLEIPHPGERKKVDVMFALDRSGSMDRHCTRSIFGYCLEWHPGNDPDGKRVDATKAFVGQMKPGDRAGAVEFNQYASPLTDQMYTHSNFDDFNESLEANANGGTYIGAGIDEALTYYEPSDDTEKIMIVLTDGKNDGQDEDGSETREIATAADADNVTIYTVGLGNERDIDEDLLMDIADITGGNYTHVSDASQLNELFRNIGKDVQGRSMTAISVNSFESSANWSNEFAIEVRQTTVTIDD